jgi:CRP/FNR family transcriptional regulator
MSCGNHENRTCIYKVPIFEHLTAEEAESLAAKVRSKRYKRGEFIFREGERSETFFILNEGTVKLSKLSETGKEQILRFLFPGDFFGHFAMLQDKTHYANAEVLDDADVCFIQKREFRQILECNPKMAYRFLLAVSERLGQADDWLGTISLMDTDKRLAKLLHLFYEKNGAQPVLRLPAQKKELAAHLGITPETLSRKLACLEENGLLEVKRNCIIVRRPELLEEYATSHPAL